jgi:uncharacterized protein RhaS with RHS repeats
MTNKKKCLLRKIVVLLFVFVALAFGALAETQELTYDSFNNATNISYDDLSRILVKNFTSGHHNYTYDFDYLETLTNVTFANGSVAYEYDNRRRVIREVRIIDGIKFEKTFYYDSADRVVRQVGSPGTEVGYIYGEQLLLIR